MHNNIRVSVVATGIGCEKRVSPVENIISDIKPNEGKISQPNNLNLDNNNELSVTSNIDKNFELDKNDAPLGGEELEKVIDTKQKSFIPPQPEVIEKKIITPEEIQMDPFTEAEVLNASSNIQTNNSPVEKVEKVKETESLIKRFTAKSIFGNSNKKNIEITDKIESDQSNLEETNVDNEDGINNKLSFSQDISMKSTEKNTNEDALDIPAFLRRQRE
jgi:hypothetical protein